MGDVQHPRLAGTVRTIVRQKGFGFIRDEAGRDYFFHHSACDDFERLTEGTAVTFAPVPPGHKGPRAELVRIT
jgi:CspA family cold shock protein